jgi:serine/threonine protein kinase
MSKDAKLGAAPTISSHTDVTARDMDTLSSGQASPRRARTDSKCDKLAEGVYPELGDRVGDFEILSLLGEGGFARVFLARQISLDRQVALKVSPNRGNEARTLASLEHDHIVRVFSETIDVELDMRRMCMQYVPGTTLGRLIDAQHGQPRASWSGPALLAALDAQSGAQHGMFDPASLRDRELIAACDHVQTVCWIGARLAEALAYAHGQGVLHRDIKPANILINPYGRPLLADFNLSFNPSRVSYAQERMFGGTLAYMAPEHLDAFNPDKAASSVVVDERSDIYSLGVVLYEMLTGELPFSERRRDVSLGDTLSAMAAERSGVQPRFADDVPPMVRSVIARCLSADPAGRYARAAELAQALTGCFELARAEREFPPAGPVTRRMLAHPFLMLAVLSFLPNVVGSVVNTSYNAMRVVGALSDPQKRTFLYLVLLYNAITYPLGVWVFVRQVRPAARTYGELRANRAVAPERVRAMRQRLLRLPMMVVLLSAVGWLPGGVLFPLGLRALTAPVGGAVFGHFVLSFFISGMIALTYALFGVQLVVVRALYPLMSSDGGDVQKNARAELAPVEPRLRRFELVAVAIPLASAAMMAAFGPESMTPPFRLLLTALIVMGMAGFGLAIAITRQILQVVRALRGAEARG